MYYNIYPYLSGLERTFTFEFKFVIFPQLMFHRIWGVVIDESIISIISYIVTTYFVGRQRRKLLSDLLAFWQKDSIEFLTKWQTCLNYNLSSRSLSDLNNSQLNTSISPNSISDEIKAQKRQQMNITTLRNEFHALIREATRLKLELRDYRRRCDDVIRYAISFLYYNIICFSRRETIGKSLLGRHLISGPSSSTVIIMPLNKLLFFFNMKIFLNSQIRYISNFIFDYLRLSAFVKSLTPTEQNLQAFLRFQIQPPQSKESMVNDNTRNNNYNNDAIEEGSSSPSSTGSITTDIMKYDYSFITFPEQEHLEYFQDVLSLHSDYFLNMSEPKETVDPELHDACCCCLRVLTAMSNWLPKNPKYLSLVKKDFSRFQGESELYLGKQKNFDTFSLFCKNLSDKYAGIKEIDDSSTNSKIRQLNGAIDIMISAGKFIFDWLSASLIEELILRYITTPTNE